MSYFMCLVKTEVVHRGVCVFVRAHNSACILTVFSLQRSLLQYALTKPTFLFCLLFCCLFYPSFCLFFYYSPVYPIVLQNWSSPLYSLFSICHSYLILLLYLLLSSASNAVFFILFSPLIVSIAIRFSLCLYFQDALVVCSYRHSSSSSCNSRREEPVIPAHHCF